MFGVNAEELSVKGQMLRFKGYGLRARINGGMVFGL